MKLFKSYKWFNPALRKKYRNNNYITYAMAALALIFWFFVPGQIKMAAFVWLFIGIYFIIKNSSIQSQDRNLRRSEMLKQAKEQKVANKV